MYYSQYGQDEWLYENYFKDQKEGVFLEIGADDGVDKSNTKFFEESLGWSGLCIEPSPKRYELLRKNRTCACEKVAVSDSIGTVEFLDIEGWGKGLSGIVENYHDLHSKRIQHEITHPENKGSQVITVETDLLNNVLEKHGIFNVDFCTIDTEGSEFEILSAFDFDKFKIRILLIENNYRDSSVRNLLISKGYKFLGKVGQIDDAFILDEKE